MNSRSDIYIIEDTRQKEGKHDNISSFFSSVGIPMVRRCLPVGDYMISTNNGISIDTKSGIDEICMDLGSETSRFRREMIKAMETKTKLVVLIEDKRFRTISDVVTWKNPNHAKKAVFMDGKELARRMRTAEISYGVSFEFCAKNNTGKRILQLLRG
jgi:hypothetical protein